jgi:hypothetical protein
MRADTCLSSMVVRLIGVFAFTVAASTTGAEAGEFTEIPGVRCQADRIEKPANTVSPVVLTGHVVVVFPTFQLSGDRIDLSWTRDRKAGPKTVLVQVDGAAVLRQGSQEVRLEHLSFTTTLPTGEAAKGAPSP